MTVNICGIPHKIVYSKDNFNTELHLGQITYSKAEIVINEALPEPMKSEALCHEIVHGILMHLGMDDLCDDEKFVQQLGNALNQSFTPKLTEEPNEEPLL